MKLAEIEKNCNTGLWWGCIDVSLCYSIEVLNRNVLIKELYHVPHSEFHK